MTDEYGLPYKCIKCHASQLAPRHAVKFQLYRLLVNQNIDFKVKEGYIIVPFATLNYVVLIFPGLYVLFCSIWDVLRFLSCLLNLIREGGLFSGKFPTDFIYLRI